MSLKSQKYIRKDVGVYRELYKYTPLRHTGRIKKVTGPESTKIQYYYEHERPFWFNKWVSEDAIVIRPVTTVEIIEGKQE